MSQVQSMKVAGVQAGKEIVRFLLRSPQMIDVFFTDTITHEQLTKASIYYLESDTRRNAMTLQLHTSIRDRAMLLLSTSMAFRGNNVCGVTWSDILVCQIPLVDIGLDYTATVRPFCYQFPHKFIFYSAINQALVIYSNQGKENTSGCIDEHGALRHRYPEHCGIGALALYFFSVFHICNLKVPDFSPDFSKGGIIGFRSWYHLSLFPGGQGEFSKMTLQSEHVSTFGRKKI